MTLHSSTMRLRVQLSWKVRHKNIIWCKRIPKLSCTYMIHSYTSRHTLHIFYVSILACPIVLFVSCKATFNAPSAIVIIIIIDTFILLCFLYIHMFMHIHILSLIVICILIKLKKWRNMKLNILCNVKNVKMAHKKHSSCLWNHWNTCLFYFNVVCILSSYLFCFVDVS